MFVLHTSNKTENLLEHLATVLSTPLSSPFSKEIFLIQSQGMQRWLSQQLADRKAVWTNFEFLFPGKFFSQLVDEVTREPGELTGNTFFNQENLLWRLESLLTDLQGDVFQPLQNYLQDDHHGLKRYQLAEQLAMLFDQYQFMRTSWLTRWEQGKSILDPSADPTRHTTESWQRELWRMLLTSRQHGDTRSKGAIWLKAIHILEQQPAEKTRKQLPERLSVFGINAMSPIYLNFLEVVSRSIDVHFYLLNPAEGYWADLPGKQHLARQQIDNSSLKEVTGNPLLSAQGQQGRDFQQLLLEQCEFELKYVSFERNEKNTVLAQLQNDVLFNTLSDTFLATDDSVRIHSCHSRMREIEVLKDQLLATLDARPDTGLRDIVIMAPDISLYAPYIEAVFNDVPHAITDKSYLDRHTPVQLFLEFLRLSQGRWELESVLAVFESPVIYEHFGLIESDLEQLRSWLNRTSVRWGESATHRQQLGFPAFTENTWQAGIERLLMGYLNADETQFCDGILPFADIEGSQAHALGGLYDFFALLSRSRRQFGKRLTLNQWAKALRELVEQLFVFSHDTQPALHSLLGMIQQLQNGQPYHRGKVALPVILDWFNREAESQRSSSGFLRGQLTFCSMLPMRAIPFRVIALLGMNEGEYPRRESHSAFDLMADDFRPGDKSSRLDQRYQFLETLLSVREQLIITYVGQSQQRQTTQPPAAVVSELLDVLIQTYQLDEKILVQKHPLQPFSPHYFDPLTSLFSYSAEYYQLCRSLHESPSLETADWWQGQLEKPCIQTIDLDDLMRFYHHPQRHFIRNQLQLVIPKLEHKTDETEPFQVDGLSLHLITQDWIEQSLSMPTQDEETFYQRLRAQGNWLSGNHARLFFNEQHSEIQAFVKQVREVPCGHTIDPIPIDLNIGNYRIVGSIDHQYAAGGLFYRYAKLKGKDLLTAWVTHLIRTQKDEATTWLVAKDQSWQFHKVADSQRYLLDLIEHYVEGLRAPSQLILEPALAWQQAFQKKQDKMNALKVSLSVYQGCLRYDADLQLLHKGLEAEQVINQQFEYACQLLTPIWAETGSYQNKTTNKQ